MRCAALLIVVAACAVSARGDGDGAAPPAPPAAADARPPLERAPDLLATVVPLVERACGAKFAAPPRVVELSRAEAEAAFAADLRPEFERRYADAPEGARSTMLRAAAQASVLSTLARYSFERREIVVVREGFERQCRALGAEGERAAALLTVTLAHEAVHALDDARFDLARLYRTAADDEAMRALAMVAEGRAVHFGRIAAAEAGAPADLVALLPGGDAPRDERAWHLHLTYRLGARFVAALVAQGGTAAADGALTSPPATTWPVCYPERWPNPKEGAAPGAKADAEPRSSAAAKPDARPAEVLARAGLAAKARTLSQLQLLERYSALAGFDSAESLFRDFTGGAQALVGETNAAVLAFADEKSAERYATRSATEAPTRREGTLVVRAMGADADAVLARLVAALAK